MAQNFDSNIKSLLKPDLSFNDASQSAVINGRFRTVRMAKDSLKGMLRQIMQNQNIVNEASQSGADSSQALAKIKATKEAIRAMYGDVLAE